MIDLADLEAKALAATQGEWVYDASPWDDDSKELTTASRVKESIVAIATVDIGFDGIVGTEQQANAAYIVAAQPRVVLELIARALLAYGQSRAEAAEAEVERLRAQSETMRKLLHEADKRIVWEHHGLGHDFTDRVEDALND